MPKTIITTSKYQVYTLDEMLADEKRKKNLIEKQNLGAEGSWYELEVLLQFDVDDLRNRTEELGYKNVEIHYDLSYCQGSGACFDFDGLYLDKLIGFDDPIHDLCYDSFQNTLDHFFQKDIQCIVHSSKNDFANHYCHSKTRYVDYEGFDTPSDSIEEEITQTQDWQEFERKLKDLLQSHYYEQCEYIYKELKDRLDYYQSEEYTIKDLQENCPDALYLEDGSIFSTRDNEEICEDNEDNNDKFEESVIIDQDGKLLSRVDGNEKPVFLDSIDEEDEGYSKAIKYNNKAQAYRAIAYMQGYEVHTVNTIFKKENK